MTARRRFAILFAAVAAFGLGSSTAMAATCYTGHTYLQGTRTMTCYYAPCGGPGYYNHVTGTVSWYRTFSSVSQVSMTITFKGDTIKPGESVNIMFDKSVGQIGFTNIGTKPITQRTIAFDNTWHPELTSLFKDGSQNFVLSMDSGSARVASVSFVLATP